MSLAADSNLATRVSPDRTVNSPASPGEPGLADKAVELALAAAVEDAGRIGELLDVLRSARLWLPLPVDGRPVVTGGAVTLPTVSYLGSEFVPAYSSAQLLQQFAGPAPSGAPPSEAQVQAAVPPQGQPADCPADAGQPPGQQPVPLPHVVVRAADLARLLPPTIGIALNAGAALSVPVYPQGVSYLAASGAADDAREMSVDALPLRPDPLLAGIAAGLIAIPAVRDAVAAWLSVPSAGEGLLVAVSLDDPGDAAARDLVVGAVERAAWEIEPDQAAFPIDVTFPGEREPDRIDERIAAVGTPFYRRA